MPRIEPFPWEAVRSLSREQTRAVQLIRRHLGSGAAEALIAWAEACLGCAPEELVLRVQAVWRSIPETVASRMREAVAYPLTGIADRRAELLIDGALVAALSRRFLRTSSAGAVAATRAEEGLVALAIAWLIAEIETIGAWTVEKPAVGASMTREPTVFVECSLRVGRRVGSLWLAIPAETLSQLDEAADGLGAQHRLDVVMLAAAVELAWVAVSIDDLGQLESGDIVVPPSSPGRECAGPHRLRVGGGAFRGTLRGEAFTIEDAYRRGDARMSVDRDRSAASVVEDLEVEVVVEAGRVQLSAKEVMRLGVGDVVTLGRPLRAHLDLRVGDRLLGRGELVDVEGETGIRVAELFD